MHFDSAAQYSENDWNGWVQFPSRLNEVDTSGWYESSRFSLHKLRCGGTLRGGWQTGSVLTLIYENVHYVRLQRKSFQTIKINVRDRTANIVPFQQGTLNVTLHFRQHKRLSTLWTWKAEACPCILEHPIREAMVLAVSWKTFSVRQLPFSNMGDSRHWEQGSLW